MALPINPNDPGNDGGGGGGGGAPGTGEPISGGAVGTIIHQVNFNKHEADSVLKVLCYASLYSPDDLQFLGYIIVDGVVRQNTVVNLIFDNQNSRGQMPLTMPAYITGVGAGNHTIIFSIRNREPDGALQVLAGSTIEVTELKRGAL